MQSGGTYGTDATPFLKGSLNDNQQTSNQNKSSVHPAYKYALYVAIILALIFAGLYIYKVRHEAHAESAAVAPVSSSSLPLSTQQWILSAMDPTADPCEDVFQFVCGAWTAQTTIPPTANRNKPRAFGQARNISQIDMQTVLNDKFQPAGTYYQGCLNFPQTISNQASVSNLAYWLQFIDSQLEASLTSVDSFFYLIGVMQSQQLGFDNFIWQLNAQQRSNFIDIPDKYERPLQRETVIAFDASSATLSSTDPLIPTNTPISKDQLATIINQVQADLKTFNLPAKVVDSTKYTVDAAVTSVFQQQSTLWKLRSNSANPDQQLTNFTALFPSPLAMKGYIRGLGDHTFPYILANTSAPFGFDISSMTGYADHLIELAVIDTGAVKGLLNFMSTTLSTCQAAHGQGQPCADFEVFRMNLKFHLLLSMLPTLPAAYSTGLTPQPQYITDRLGYCNSLMQGDFLNVLQNEAFIEFFQPGTRQAVNDLIEIIYTELGQSILANPWLDQVTRTKAINKWQLITKNVMYDQSWFNVDYGLITTGQFHLDFIAGHSYRVQRLVSLLDLLADVKTPEQDQMNPWHQDAFYDPNLNSINMLPGLMLFPIFDVTNPMMMNLATYGWIIGHEFTHGFDNNGRLYDGVGQNIDWWSEHSSNEFIARSDCFIKQYSNYSMFGLHINGTQCLPEDIADNGGISLAWRSYRAYYSNPVNNATLAEPLLPGYTNDQLFWIYGAQQWCAVDSYLSLSLALQYDVHAPFEIRPRAALQNQVGYAESFGCAPHTWMGRSLTNKTCVIW